MVAEEILNNEFPVLDRSDICMKAVTLMDEYNLSHYPVLDGEKLSGLLFEDDLYAVDNWETSIADSGVKVHPVFANSAEHLLTITARMSKAGLTCLPVVNDKQIYQGIITISELMKIIGSLPFVKDPGGLIELEIPVIDYMLSDIVRIIESNHFRILGMYFTSVPEQRIIRLSVKLNKSDIRRAIDALERHQYKVTASYQNASENDNLQDRYDNLMHILNL